MDVTETKEATEKTETTAEAKPEMVPKERLDDISTKLKAAEEQNLLLQQNQALLRANAPAATKAETFDIYKEVGLEGPEDMPNQEQQRKINAYFEARNNAQIAQLRFLIDHPDYSQLVGTADQIQSGQFAEPLKEAIRENPTLMETIRNSANPQAAAYGIAKLHAKKKEEGAKTTKTEAQQAIDEAVENAKRVKTAANTKGGEALSEEGRVVNMSDAEFIKLFNASGGDL